MAVGAKQARAEFCKGNGSTLASRGLTRHTKLKSEATQTLVVGPRHKMMQVINFRTSRGSLDQATTRPAANLQCTDTQWPETGTAVMRLQSAPVIQRLNVEVVKQRAHGARNWTCDRDLGICLGPGAGEGLQGWYPQDPAARVAETCPLKWRH